MSQTLITELSDLWAQRPRFRWGDIARFLSFVVIVIAIAKLTVAPAMTLLEAGFWLLMTMFFDAWFNVYKVRSER